MGTYLDKTGLQTLWTKIKDRDTATLNAAKNDASAKDTALLNDIAASYIALTLKGAANGVAPLDASKRIPTEYLPGFVDDVVEGTYVNSTTFNNTTGTAITGEASKIYVSTDTNKTYRWSGSAYVEISASLALGETTGTAYDGAKGAALAKDLDENYYTKTEADALLTNMVEWYEKPSTTATSILTVYQGKILSSPFAVVHDFNSGSSNIPTTDAITDYLESNYQPKLVSGTNIKTVNGQSILGSGNISIEVDNLDMSGYYTKTETDAAFVKLTGDQTIGGSKTFSDDAYFNSEIYIKTGKGINFQDGDYYLRGASYGLAFDGALDITKNVDASYFEADEKYGGGNTSLARLCADGIMAIYTDDNGDDNENLLAFPTKAGTFVVQNNNIIGMPAGGIMYKDGINANEYAGFCIAPQGVPVVVSKDRILAFTQTEDYVMYTHEYTFPDKNGTVALTSDIPTALTTAEIDEICV